MRSRRIREFAVENPICRMPRHFYLNGRHFPPRSIKNQLLCIVCAEMIPAGKMRGSLSLFNLIRGNKVFKKVPNNGDSICSTVF